VRDLQGCDIVVDLIDKLTNAGCSVALQCELEHE